MESLFTLLQNNPSVAVWLSVAAIVFARYGLYPFFGWLRSLSTANQAIVTAHSAEQRSSDAITNKALDIIADNTTATNALLRQYGADISHIRTTTDQHHSEFRAIDIDKRLSAIEAQGITNGKEIKLVRQGIIYIAKNSDCVKKKELTA